jgi:hypothetical protein
LTILSLLESGDGDVPSWNLDLDQWVSGVVSVPGQRFTIGAEIGVMADCTFVAIADDITLGIGAQRSVTIDTTMELLRSTNVGKASIDRCKAVTWMGLASDKNTRRAVVKVGARQALVSNAREALDMVNQRVEVMS